MSDNATFRIFTSPNYVPSDRLVRDVDSEDLYKTMIIFGLENLFAEGDDQKVIAYFYDDEVRTKEGLLLSNQDILIPLQRVVYANWQWRNLMILWKSAKRVYEQRLRQQAKI